LSNQLAAFDSMISFHSSFCLGVSDFGGDKSVALPGGTMERLVKNFLAIKIAQNVIDEMKRISEGSSVSPERIMPPPATGLIC
jgi:hypothetical protein